MDCSSNLSSRGTSKQNVDYLIEQGKKLWEQRTDPISFNKAAHFLSLANSKDPENFELSILCGKINFTTAYFVEDSPSEQDSLYYNGAITCKNAVINHPDFKKLYKIQTDEDSTLNLITAIENAPPSVVPGLYWWAVNQLRYLNRQPILNRLKNRELLEVIMHRVITLEPGYFFSGPYRFYGSLYTRIPGVELSQSKTYFEQAIAANPEYLGNAVLMAEFYHQKAGNRELFNKILKEVSNANLAKNPELLLENFFYQRKAMNLLKNESLLFE